MGRCYNTAIINAPVEEVWNAIKDFHDFSWSKNVITKVEIAGDAGGSEVGAKLILNDVFHETLQSLDHEKREITYTIDEEPGPLEPSRVTSYVGAARLLPITQSDTPFAEWQSNFETADDSAVGEFCDPIYQALLKDMQAHFE